jgi:hypothetical protein
MNMLINNIALQTTSPSMFIGTLVAVGLFILIIFIVSSFEDKKGHKEQERQREIYNSPEEIKKREDAQLRKQKEKEKLRLNFKKYKNENAHIFNSSKNLKLSIVKLSELISFCKKCENRNYTVWELSEKSMIIRCDICKRKYPINNEISQEIYNNYNYYLELSEYCRSLENRINIIWKTFKFNRDKFNINTPLYRGLTFKGFGTKQLEEPKVENEKSSRRISQTVKDKVWNRDGGKCVECGSNENLEFDHIIPHSKGGANTYRNIQLLCEPCNRSKSAKIG